MPDTLRYAPMVVSTPPLGTVRAWMAFLAFHVVSALCMVAVMASVPEPSGMVALIYSPALTAAEAFLHAAATGARLVRPGNFAWIVVVAPEPDDTGFSARARAGGALAIVNPMFAGCSIDKRLPRT